MIILRIYSAIVLFLTILVSLLNKDDGIDYKIGILILLMPILLFVITC